MTFPGTRIVSIACLLVATSLFPPLSEGIGQCRKGNCACSGPDCPTPKTDCSAEQAAKDGAQKAYETAEYAYDGAKEAAQDIDKVIKMDWSEREIDAHNLSTAQESSGSDHDAKVTAAQRAFDQAEKQFLADIAKRRALRDAQADMDKKLQAMARAGNALSKCQKKYGVTPPH